MIRDQRRRGEAPEHVLRLSADSPPELARLLAAPDERLLAATSAQGPADPAGANGCRLGIVAPTGQRLALARKLVASRRTWRGRNDIWFSPDPLLTERGHGIAFMFPGLEADFAPSIDDVAAWLGTDAPSIATVSVGRHAQAVVGVGHLLVNALHRLAVRPAAMAGHSVGEWSAMIAGGMVDNGDVAGLFTRTDLDSILVPDVDFGVLGCGVDRVTTQLRGRADVVVSHENSTSQTVVCGPVRAVAELVAALRSQGVVCQILPFRSGFHTPMMRPYRTRIAEGIGQLPVRAARIPVWSATTMAPFPADPAAIRALYVRHLLEPVRFRGLVQAMYDAGIRAFVQVGAGQLGSLIDDTLREKPHLTVAANSAHRQGMAQLRRLATALWVEGNHPDFAALDTPAQPTRLPAPAPLPKAPVTSDALARLDEIGEQFPPAAQLGQIIREVVDAVSTVIVAGRATPLSAPAPLEQTLRISTVTMPYLLDHCIAKQRTGWPDESDRRPIVPATTMITHMMDAAQRSAPGRVAIGVDDVQLHRWLVAAPECEVTVRVRPLDQTRVRVSIVGHADAIVVLGERYEPAHATAWPPAREERIPALSAEQLYEQRHLFHGPAFQAVTRSTAISARGVRGEITVPDAPGALLDGVGQVLGQWLTEYADAGCQAFPVHIGRIRYHAPEPVAGTTVDCSVRIVTVTDATVEADAQVSLAGHPMVSISGWRDRQFGGDTITGAAYRFPELSTLSQRQPGGWWSLTERWPDLASRELSLYKYFAADERIAYDRCPPVQRRRWLLEHIVAKDAVRGWLWDHGAGPLFPAEIDLVENSGGRFVATGRHGLSVPPLKVAVAHCGEIAVATVRRGADVEADRLADDIQIAEIPDPDTAVQVMRSLAASVANHGHRMHTALVNNPDGLPRRQYVVAWTVGTDQDSEQDNDKENAS